jgi:hypothetical protein
VARSRGAWLAGILLADSESGSEPLHVTVVGGKADPKAAALFRAALTAPGGYKRVEWWDPKEGPLPNPDVQYPPLEQAAAFLCTNGACSAPIAKPEALTKKIGTSASLATTPGTSGPAPRAPQP